MAIKRGLGKLKTRHPLGQTLEKARRHGLQLVPLRIEHILNVEALPAYHRDPFDRLLMSVSHEVV
jgi:PIN domain nuclease of toxin-antitoxin system